MQKPVANLGLTNHGFQIIHCFVFVSSSVNRGIVRVILASCRRETGERPVQHALRMLC
jgi:hypothetical protein